MPVSDATLDLSLRVPKCTTRNNVFNYGVCVQLLWVPLPNLAPTARSWCRVALCYWNGNWNFLSVPPLTFISSVSNWLRPKFHGLAYVHSQIRLWPQLYLLVIKRFVSIFVVSNSFQSFFHSCRLWLCDNIFDCLPCLRIKCWQNKGQENESQAKLRRTKKKGMARNSDIIFSMMKGTLRKKKKKKKEEKTALEFTRWSIRSML